MKEVSAKKLSVKKRKLKNSAEKDVKDENHYELADFVVRHFRIPNWREYNGNKYYPKELVAFLTDVIELLRTEKALCHISPPVTIVGDLNGHFQDLVRIFNIKNEKTLKEEDGKQVFATEKFVFLGDFTGDNQKYNLETVCLLFGLKMLYCNRYILLRGYEETRSNTEFRNQIMSKFPGAVGEDIWSKFKTAFSLLPAAAIVGEKILCVHSGISPLVKRSIGELKEIPKRDVFENLAPIVRDVIFARPCEPDEDGADSEDPLYIFHEPTNTRKFNDAAIKHFCEKEKIDLVVRSHAVLSNGFRFSADKKLITIFSSPSYKDMPNKGAFLRVSQEGVVSIIQLRPTDKKENPEDKKKKKKSGETGKTESAEKEKRSKEKPKKGSRSTVSESKEKGSKEKTEEGDKKKKKANSKPKSREIESLYDNLSEK
ncbi:hypothetical protein B9Z55_013709 [Caenorhabditis nigoni]|uniref:Serine/threonine specific protein phosphatases domain-containing protein n=2 Tax=Caenorhabditis nigoni TaxID=1611254 RepID=A0A2G5U354_9PELO|nr:hypothetical protein B9Z55_013709 [Caenorhabditis nigoni]